MNWRRLLSRVGLASAEEVAEQGERLTTAEARLDRQKARMGVLSSRIDNHIRTAAQRHSTLPHQEKPVADEPTP